MFTGIIEAQGTIEKIDTHGTNYTYWVSSVLAPQLKIDQSLSHDGVCLTVEELQNNLHRVTAIEETLNKTNLHRWQVGSKINLERCLQTNGRLDGHYVSGHVDDVAVCTAVADKNGSWEYSFEFDKKFANLVIEKGSIAINGTSLTIFNVGINSFTIAVIPYTYDHTTIKQVGLGSKVNIEFDMIGKYIQRSLLLHNL
jgi:riboflavin synthase